MRRLRKNSKIRQLVRETVLLKNDLIMPLFIKEGDQNPEEIKSMPGQYRIPLKNLRDEVSELVQLGIPGVILFGIPLVKNDIASQAYSPTGIIQKAIKEIKDEVGEDLIVITDVCLCEYMDHGHCGVVKNKEIINDDTIKILQKVALSHVESGVDIVAPSDMMDGRIKAIRESLDAAGFENTIILSYAAKFASSFYGPFRDAAGSFPIFGNRNTYQMDSSNINEAIKEAYLDIEEGADILMVKPALAYLDVIQRVKDEFHLPTAAFNVSGEYSLVKAAAEKGYIDEVAVVLELLTSIKRAGADIIITYHAKDVAKWLNGK